ncbi:unnamed protein product [Miscanthus lutarioriparius]|uniref:EF-hand domain-containing protein n=1 Tax=Miscanthus lutarioriparius TaxID=422564 RepID=A0A811RG64_9POAL|nr:unnamed protein product [Miscanthus lutarioriparius]
MKLSVPFCGSSSSAAASPKASKASKSRRRSKDGKKSGGSSSFSSTASSHECAFAVTTPRTVLLPPSPLRTSAPGAGSTSRTSSWKPPAVTQEELEVALRRVVSSEEELAEMLAEADTGLVVDAVAAAGDEGDHREAFAVFDADGDGRISAKELRAVLASLGDDYYSVDDCRRMIGGVDVDGDGFVCFDEFSRMMMHGL